MTMATHQPTQLENDLLLALDNIRNTQASVRSIKDLARVTLANRGLSNPVKTFDNPAEATLVKSLRDIRDAREGLEPDHLRTWAAHGLADYMQAIHLIENPSPKSFHVHGSICITDPCYDRGVRCAAWDLPAKPGPWRGEAEIENHGSWGDRVARILVVHEDHLTAKPVTLLPYSIGVDSGQAGVFDGKTYPDGDTGDYENLDTFYGRACALIMSDERTGHMLEGFVSSSGFGDGSYRAYGAYEGDDLVAVAVEFIPDEEEDSCWNCGEVESDCCCEEEE